MIKDMSSSICKNLKHLGKTIFYHSPIQPWPEQCRRANLLQFKLQYRTRSTPCRGKRENAGWLHLKAK